MSCRPVTRDTATTAHMSHEMIGFIFVATALAICLPLLYFLFPKHKWLPNIPIKSDHWLVGLKGFDNGNVIHELVQKYGPLIQFSLYFHKILVIADKNLARVALKEINGKGFFHNPTPDWVADSIFSFDTGPEWQKRRGMFRKAFSTSSLRYHTKSVVKLNEKLSQVLEKAAEKNEVVRIDDLFVQLTVGVICELAFELDVKVFDSSTNTLRVDEAIQELFKYGWVRRIPFAKYFYTLPIYPLKDYKFARDTFEGKMGEIYDHMKKLRDEGKLREESLALALVKFGDLPGIERRDVIAELATLFVAGMDTTAHTMSFTIYALARYPEIQKQCQEEVLEHSFHIRRKGSEGVCPCPCPCSWGGDPFVESMRRWPTAATGSFRVVRQPEGVQLTPTLHIPQGWWILVCIYALHNSKEAWGEDVNQFIPERWISKDGTLLKSEGDDAKEEEDPLSAVEESDESKSKTAEKNARADNSRLASASSYAGAGYSSDELCFVPFSNGLRNCIGMNLAMMELRITLFKLISKFHFSLGNEEAMKDENQIFETAFTMRPRRGCPIRISKR